MFTKAFLVAAAERAVKTFGQALVALLGAGVVNVVHTAWVNDLEVGAGAAVLSLLSSIATGAVDGNPSFGNAEKVAK